MYDKFGSPQWVFDICIVASKLNYLVVIFIGALLSTFLYLVLKTRVHEKSAAASLVTNVLTLVLTAISVFGIIFVISFIAPEIYHSPDMKERIFFTLIMLSPLVTILFLLSNRWKHGGITLIPYKAILFGTLFFLPISFVIYFFVGIFNCSAAGQFFLGIYPAHEIHATMKDYYQRGLGWPKSEEELKNLDTSSYYAVITNAKTKYVYDLATGSYTWFVRPSRYQVFIFDDKRDFAIYTLSSLFNFTNTKAHYPPSYEGPWDQLPD